LRQQRIELHHAAARAELVAAGMNGGAAARRTGNAFAAGTSPGIGDNSATCDRRPLVHYEWIKMPDSSGFGSYTESGTVIPARLRGEAVNFVAQTTVSPLRATPPNSSSTVRFTK
jgi:hypothetical protein